MMMITIIIIIIIIIITIIILCYFCFSCLGDKTKQTAFRYIEPTARAPGSISKKQRFPSMYYTN